MKKMIILAMLACVAFAGCSKSDDNGNSDGPKQFPTDVATAIKDIVFRQYCIEHFDANKDGKLSKDEALGVNVIELKELDIYSLAGIEYFTNLRELYCESLKIENVDISSHKLLGANFKFYYCSDLKTAKLPKELTVIPEEAFRGCGLTTITIPSKVAEIGECGFTSCESLVDITIMEGLETIGAEAFSYCKALTSITLPSTIKRIGRNAFIWANNLETIYCKASIPPTCGDFSEKVRIDIYVPRQSVAAYKSANGWKIYADYIKGYDF